MAEAPAAMRTFLLEAMRRPELRARRCSASPATSPTRRTPSTVLSADLAKVAAIELFRARRRTTPCNPHPSLLAAMSALGSGFDCNSPAEMHAVLLGVAADHIVIYAVSRATRTVFAAAVELGSPPSSAARFEDARDVINVALAEPDRYFTETPFMLAARIFGNRTLGEVREYWIDDGFYGKLSCVANISKYIPRDHALCACGVACHSVAAGDGDEGGETHSSTVLGPTINSLDVVFSMILARAYTTIVSCKFNGFSASAMKTYLASSA
ncbi:hypothetical protein HU200_034155 [Digitaria exilis]|uniref:Orn/DAP/Arg decarboxylase 2 N-terminal domain-containing protein n=1 Tax=Digitaria exilis TaxID=1010633 RepID=A0A835BKK5_9POAL|nr:hypothetical protein HU200_034155 [Digitaria exilis]